VRLQRIWVGRWRNLPVHSPLRDYYKLRNTTRLFIREEAPLRWRLFALRYIAQLFGQAVLGSDRAERLRFLCFGVRDGLRRTGGKYVEVGGLG
jgi:rhamnosyltransferase